MGGGSGAAVGPSRAGPVAPTTCRSMTVAALLAYNHDHPLRASAAAPTLGCVASTAARAVVSTSA